MDKKLLELRHKKRMKKIELENLQEEYRQEEEDAKRKKRKKIPYSKIVMGLLFILALQIVIYAEYIMFLTRDVAPLYTLIGISASLTAAFFGYLSHSKAENTKGGIVYDSAMAEMGMHEEEENSDGDEAVG